MYKQGKYQAIEDKIQINHWKIILNSFIELKREIIETMGLHNELNKKRRESSIIATKIQFLFVV